MPSGNRLGVAISWLLLCAGEDSAGQLRGTKNSTGAADAGPLAEPPGGGSAGAGGSTNIGAEARCTPGYSPQSPQKYQNCIATHCCMDPLQYCFEKGNGWAACLYSCTPGVHYDEQPWYWTPWSCRYLGGGGGGGGGGGATTRRPVTLAPTQAPWQPPTQAPWQPPTQAPWQPPTQAPWQPPTQAPTQPPTQAPTTLPPWFPSPSTPPPSGGYSPQDPSLKSASKAPVLTFYMYRAVSDEDYPPENVNTANLPGVLWYLQNEVVVTQARKFKITRILRYLVQTRATQPLANKGLNFGVRFAFDSGLCTGPYSCQQQWDKYGYFVGCNNLGDFPYPTYQVPYQDGIWYSLPGQCPSRQFSTHNAECQSREPGGSCSGTPTGSGFCTYRWQTAGDIRLNELEGDKGQSFWNNANDASACAARVAAAKALFLKKYPAYLDLPDPRCDFDIGKFYDGGLPQDGK